VSEWQDTEYGKAPANWALKTIGDISAIVTDGAHFSPKPQSAGMFMCSVKDMRYDRFHFEDSKLISQDDYQKLVEQGCQPKSGDILISKDGANCLDLIFVFNQQENVVLLSSIAIVRLKNDYNPHFVRYFLLSPNCQETMRNNFVSGSAIPRVVLKDFKKVPILVPLIEEQKAIASVLSSLDDKIDLLHRQNTTLERLAETLFIQWFVEEAQVNWQRERIGDVLTTVLGGTPSTTKPEYWNGTVPWINSGEINKFRILEATKFISELGLKKSNAKLLPVGTTVVAITGATLGQVSLLEIETCANQSVIGIIPSERLTREFVFLWVKLKIEEIILSETGGAQPHINKNDINNTEILIPPADLLYEKNKIFEAWFNKITTNVFQIQTLEKLRDNLLPKLMSGETKLG